MRKQRNSTAAHTLRLTCHSDPKGWLGYGDWRDAISAFLFTFSATGAPEKCVKVGGSGMAVIDEAGAGPAWGPDGLSLNLSNRTARSRLGSYYRVRSGGERTLFTAAEKGNAKLEMVRIYVGNGQSPKAEKYVPNAMQF